MILASRGLALACLAVLVGVVAAGCGSRLPGSTPVAATASPSPLTAASATPTQAAAPSPTSSPFVSAWPSAQATPTPGPPVSARTTSGGATMTVRLDHGSIPTAGLLTMTVVVQADSGSLNGLTVKYGDGQRYDAPMAVAGCAPPPATPVPAPPSTQRLELLVSYRVAGSYAVDVEAHTNGMCAPAPNETLQARLRVTVTPGPRQSNGPQLPEPPATSAEPSQDQDEDQDQTRLSAYSDDPDGFVASFRWDFGDGSGVVVDEAPRADCKDPQTRWPDNEFGYGASEQLHRFPRPGNYTVRVTVLSSGCDGADPQRVTRSTVVRA